jgi:hypothetical protein
MKCGKCDNDRYPSIPPYPSTGQNPEEIYIQPIGNKESNGERGKQILAHKRTRELSVQKWKVNI